MVTYCELCGIKMEEGAMRYLVTVHATADFDGTLPADGNIEDLEAFMRAIDRKDASELEHDVYQSKAFILCPTCKAAYMKNPMAPHTGPAPEDEGNEEGRVH